MHYFWAKYWEMLSTARGSEAIMLESYPTGVSSKNSRLQSALSTCELVAWKNEMQVRRGSKWLVRRPTLCSSFFNTATLRNM